MVEELYQLKKISFIGQEGEGFFYEFLANLPAFIDIFITILD